MKGNQPKRKKKSLTLDRFAVLIQQDLARIATKHDLANFVTKDDIWPIQRDVNTLISQMRDVRGDVQMITETMVSKADLANTLAAELEKSAFARQVADLDQRVQVIEKKLGIKHLRRAA